MLKIYSAILIGITGVVLSASLPSPGSLRRVFASVCETDGNSYKEAQFDVWVVAARVSNGRLQETGPIQDARLRLFSTGTQREKYPASAGCGARVGDQEPLRTTNKGYVRITPINAAFNPFALEITELPAGAVFRGATASTVVNPKLDTLQTNLGDFMFKAGEKRALKVYYEMKNSTFDRFLENAASRLRPASRPAPTPTPKPSSTQSLNDTPKTGPNIWILLAALWALFIGNYLRTLRTW